MAPLSQHLVPDEGLHRSCQSVPLSLCPSVPLSLLSVCLIERRVVLRSRRSRDRNIVTWIVLPLASLRENHWFCAPSTLTVKAMAGSNNSRYLIGCPVLHSLSLITVWTARALSGFQTLGMYRRAPWVAYLWQYVRAHHPYSRR